MSVAIPPDGLCQAEGCREKATRIAASRRTSDDEPWDKVYSVGVYCEAHAIEVARGDFSEYEVECPACRCLFGVG